MKTNKNLIIGIICICISIISVDIQIVNSYLHDFSSDFYKSYNIEEYLYVMSTNSVYTVLGDSASEKMLKYKRESTDIINKEVSAQIFTIDNKSERTYSNHGVENLDSYMRIVKDYPYIYEINFNDNKMYLLKGKEKIKVETTKFGNLGKTRKEDATTYIAIPDIAKIKETGQTKNEDMLYLKYRQYVGYYKETIAFIGSKIIAIIILVIFLVSYIKKCIQSRGFIKKSKYLNIVIFLFVGLYSIITSYISNFSILYLPINTIVIYAICKGGINLTTYIQEERVAEIKLFKLIKKSGIQNSEKWNVIKMTIILIIVVCIELLIMFILGVTYTGYIWMESYQIYTILTLNLLVALSPAYWIFKKINNIESIKFGIKEIKKGNLNYKIDIKKDSLFKEMVDDINEIGDSINDAVEDRIKSERMKTELITNVSHDLKTPLTAIINYISLMKKEDIKPEHIKDYVQVLDKRSQRLKILIDDLFEASKIGSDSIELNLEKTDIKQLLHQSLVEMDDYIEESKLDFIINTPEYEVYIMADGRKTFRIFENLISNIIKYSLENTRVYIDLIEKENKVYITFKNISKHQLNFDAQEITERFTRGDLSRNTEGSGLGLAIAKGFTEAQGGSFKVDILGDMFIVTIDFNLIKD